MTAVRCLTPACPRHIRLPVAPGPFRWRKHLCFLCRRRAVSVVFAVLACLTVLGLAEGAAP